MILNEINSNIKSTNLSFLDVIVNKRNTRILTDMYNKLTDTHNNLQFGFCYHIKPSIPYNLVRCIYTILRLFFLDSRITIMQT